MGLSFCLAIWQMFKLDRIARILSIKTYTITVQKRTKFAERNQKLLDFEPKNNFYKSGEIIEKNMVKGHTMSKSASNALILILIIFTFPIWIGLAGGLFGLMMGLFGAFIGIVAGFFGLLGGALGAIIGAIAEVFSWVFGGFFGWDYYPNISLPRPLTLIVIVFVIALIVQSRKKQAK